MTAVSSAHVVVVGAGISGVAAAYYLRTAGVHVTLLEKSDRIGGHVRVGELAGLPVDEGAESLLNRRPEAVELARQVGLADDVVYPERVPAGLWSKGVVRRLPPGTVMGVPSSPGALTGILTPSELSRVADEERLPPLHLHHDVSIGDLVAERMGRPVTDRLVEPLLGGVYAGRASELSLRATVPALADAVSNERSLMAAAARVLRGSGRSDGATGGSAPEGASRDAMPVFAGIEGGVGRLPTAVAAAAGATVRTGVTVRRVTRGVNQEAAPVWRLETGPAPHPEHIDADAVVVATPSPAAGRLLADVAPHAAAELRAVETASVGIVTLAVPKAAFDPVPRMSGFLVPPLEGRVVKAVTLSSVKWPWLGERADDLVVLRASVGRHREEGDLQRGDAELVGLVSRELAEALGMRGAPVDSMVTRWGGALPQYSVGHADRMTRVQAAVDAIPGLAVCGAAYAGVGLPACIAGARRAATSVLEALQVVTPSVP